MAASVVLGFFVLIGMHAYYPGNALSRVVQEAAMSTPVTGFALGPVISFSVGLLIEYTIVVFAIFLFLRSVSRSFQK